MSTRTPGTSSTANVVASRSTASRSLIRGRSYRRKSVADGLPSAPRLDGRSSSSRSKKMLRETDQAVRHRPGAQRSGASPCPRSRVGTLREPRPSYAQRWRRRPRRGRTATSRPSLLPSPCVRRPSRHATHAEPPRCRSERPSRTRWCRSVRTFGRGGPWTARRRIELPMPNPERRRAHEGEPQVGAEWHLDARPSRQPRVGAGLVLATRRLLGGWREARRSRAVAVLSAPIRILSES